MTIGTIINGFELIDKKDKKGYWKVKHTCGRIFDFRIHLAKKQKYCKGCIEEYRKLNFGSNHKSWKGHGELSSDVFTTIKLNSQERKLNFDITIEYLWELFLKQNRKCSLSGLDIYLNEKCSEKKYKTATLDRIDSKMGYIKGNVQWIHRDINKMKNNFPENYFIGLCEKICNFKEQNNENKIEGNQFYKNGILKSINNKQ